MNVNAVLDAVANSTATYRVGAATVSGLSSRKAMIAAGITGRHLKTREGRERAVRELRAAGFMVVNATTAGQGRPAIVVTV